MRSKSTLPVLVFLATALPSAAGGEPVDPCFRGLPFGCFVTKSTLAAGNQKNAIAGRLGAPIAKLSNTTLLVHGKSIQVNIIEAETNAGAAKIHKTISGMKNHPAYCLLRGRKVIEFCKADAAAATKTAFELGFRKKPKQIRYLVTAHIATIEKPDYMSANKLFNVFLKTNTRNPSKDALAQISKLSRGFQFGKSLALRVQRKSDGSPAYELSPKPARSEGQKNGKAVFHFTRPPSVIGVPYVTLKADITCNETGFTPNSRKPDRSLLSATPHWPVDDPDVVALSRRITAGKNSREAKVQSILEWLTPGRNIKSAGPAGSRWGVKKVLKQKYGHCWDSSDCFVALARAAGVPCRQVAGWLYGSCGHVWAEVLMDGKGWHQVDPTGGGKLPCGIYHIPYFTTETGDMPILYVSMPSIRISETK